MGEWCDGKFYIKAPGGSGNIYVDQYGNYYTRQGHCQYTPVTDARVPQSPVPTGIPPYQFPASFSAGLKDWYLIALALVFLYIVMVHFPKWGVPFGLLVFFGAILFTPDLVNGFNTLVKIIQEGTVNPT